MASKQKGRFGTHLRAVLALLLAWIVPGAGHALIGRPIRGIIIFVVIGATFWTGMAMGGAMTVDPQNQRWWFAAEMLTGVHGLIGWQRQAKTLSDLREEVRPKLKEEGGDLLNRIRNLRKDLINQERELARLDARIRAARTSQEKEALRNRSERLMDARLKSHQEMLRCQGQLNTLHSTLVTKELSDKKLTLVAPVATVARAYAGIAGLLNLMCIFDALMVALIGTSVLAKASEQEDHEDNAE